MKMKTIKFEIYNRLALYYENQREKNGKKFEACVERLNATPWTNRKEYKKLISLKDKYYNAHERYTLKLERCLPKIGQNL